MFVKGTPKLKTKTDPFHFYLGSSQRPALGEDSFYPTQAVRGGEFFLASWSDCLSVHDFFPLLFIVRETERGFAWLTFVPEDAGAKSCYVAENN